MAFLFLRARHSLLTHTTLIGFLFSLMLRQRLRLSFWTFTRSLYLMFWLLRNGKGNFITFWFFYAWLVMFVTCSSPPNDPSSYALSTVFALHAPSDLSASSLLGPSRLPERISKSNRHLTMMGHHLPALIYGSATRLPW